MALTLTNFVQDQIDEIEDFVAEEFSSVSSLGIESGSNSNGNYAKFPDGTMMQWGVETITSYPHTKTLPVAFIDSSWACTCSRGYNSTAAFAMLGSTITTQTCQFYCVTHTGGTLSGGTVHWHAMGKWK